MRKLRGTAAVNAARVTCQHGHPLDAENTYYRPDGRGRQCRRCKTEANRRWKARRREREKGHGY